MSSHSHGGTALTPCNHDHNHSHSHDHKHISNDVILNKDVGALGSFLEHIKNDRDARKLTILLSINLACTFLEFIYGFLSNSIGLISDAAHMLFDSTALAVGVYASYKSTLPPNHKFSFGYERFQTLSGFINGIFLIFIAFYIFIESLERIYSPPVVDTSKMIIVAIIGLIVNLVGVIFFHEHAHFHGIDEDHSHAKGGKANNHSHANHTHKTQPQAVQLAQINNHHNHNHNDSVPTSHTTVASRREEGKVPTQTSIEEGYSSDATEGNILTDRSEHIHNHDHKDHHDHKHGPNCNHSHNHTHDHNEKHNHKHSHGHSHGHDHHHPHNENLYGIFLHILADLMGSVGVITSSIMIMMFNWHIADAICSAATSLLILASVVPLLKSSILIFLQTYPAGYEKVFHQVLSEISQFAGVVECKEPHLWAYTHEKLVCSLILVLKQNTTNVDKVVKTTKSKLQSIKNVKYVTVDYQYEEQ